LMDQDHLRKLLDEVRSGSVEVDSAMERLRHMPFEDLGFAKVDHHRALRQGMPEVIFGQGKTPEEVATIAEALVKRSQNVLITRADPAAVALVQERIPDVEYFPRSRAIRVQRDRTMYGKGVIAIACAGTSDLPVAEEARITAEAMGNEVDAITDIGVAGIHRLMSNRERLTKARVASI